MTHKVTLRIKDPSFQEGGQVFPGDLDAECETVWHVDPADCDHRDTLCMTCVRDWTQENWATIHFGPETGLQPTFSLNQMVELQAEFVTAAQLLHTAIASVCEGFDAAAGQVLKSIKDALKAPTN